MPRRRALPRAGGARGRTRARTDARRDRSIARRDRRLDASIDRSIDRSIAEKYHRGRTQDSTVTDPNTTKADPNYLKRTRTIDRTSTRRSSSIAMIDRRRSRRARYPRHCAKRNCVSARRVRWRVRAIARSRGRASVGRAARTRAIGAIEARDRRRSSIASPDRASDGGDDDGGDG